MAAQGFGSCIIGVYDRKKISELLNIPAEKQFGALIALGYPSKDIVRQKKRKAFEGIVRFIRIWENFMEMTAQIKAYFEAKDGNFDVIDN